MKTKILILLFLLFRILISQETTKNNIINDTLLWNFITENLKDYEISSNIKLKVVTRKDRLIFRKLKNGYLVKTKSIPRFSTITLIDTKAHLMKFDKNKKDYFVKILFDNDTGYVHSGFLFQFQDINKEKKAGTVYSKTNLVNIRNIKKPFRTKEQTKSIFDKFFFLGKIKKIKIPKGMFDFAILKDNKMIAIQYLRKVYGLYRNPINQQLYLLELNNFNPGKVFDITEYPEIKNIIKYAKLLYDSKKKLKEQKIAINIRDIKKDSIQLKYEYIRKNFLLNYINYYALQNINTDYINIFCDIHGLTTDKISKAIFNKFIKNVINDTNNLHINNSIDSLEVLINDFIYKLKIMEYTNEKGKYYLLKKTVYDISFLGILTTIFSTLSPILDDISNSLSQYEPENIKAPNFIKNIKNVLTSNKYLILSPIYIAYLYKSYQNSFSLTENEFNYILNNFKANQILDYKKSQLKQIDSTFFSSFTILDSLLNYLNLNNTIKQDLIIKWQECKKSNYSYQLKNRYAIYLYQSIIITYYKALYGKSARLNKSYSYKVKKYLKNLFKKSISSEEEKDFKNIMNFVEWLKNFNLIKK